MRFWIHVETFDLGSPAEKAKKVLEEGAEACEAARELFKRQELLGGSDHEGRERRHVLHECCDAIQAAVNLMAYMGADQTEIDSVMEEVRCGNVQRGRYE